MYESRNWWMYYLWMNAWMNVLPVIFGPRIYQSCSSMNEWMDEWMNAWMDLLPVIFWPCIRQSDLLIDWKHEWMNVWIDKWMNVLPVNEWMCYLWYFGRVFINRDHRWMNEACKNEWMNECMDECASCDILAVYSSIWFTNWLEAWRMNVWMDECASCDILAVYSSIWFTNWLEA